MRHLTLPLMSCWRTSLGWHCGFPVLPPFPCSIAVLSTALAGQGVVSYSSSLLMCCVNISAGLGGLGSLPYFSVFSVAALPAALCGSLRRAECGIVLTGSFHGLEGLPFSALAANPSFRNLDFRYGWWCYLWSVRLCSFLTQRWENWEVFWKLLFHSRSHGKGETIYML